MADVSITIAPSRRTIFKQILATAGGASLAAKAMSAANTADPVLAAIADFKRADDTAAIADRAWTLATDAVSRDRLYREYERLRAIALLAYDRVVEARPNSVSGAATKLEFVYDEEPWIATVIADLRRLAA